MDVRLTPEGHLLAEELGAFIGNRLGVLHTSPVGRCVETSQAIARGAKKNTEIVQDRLLGDPGVYVADGKLAGSTIGRLGHESVVDALIACKQLDGWANPLVATRTLVEHIMIPTRRKPGVHVFVTHDTLVTTAAAHCLEAPLTKAEWPLFLEALILVPSDNGVRAKYRHWSGRIPWL